MGAALLAAALALVLAPGAIPDAIAGELARLAGHRVTVRDDGGYVIEDVAGEGKPLVGVVARRGAELWLETEAGPAYRLIGPLARPRIAGPGYKVWVLGDVAGTTLRARRLGVLAAPPRARPDQPARRARSTSRAISGGAPTRIGGPQ